MSESANDDLNSFRLKIRSFINKALPETTRKRLRMGYFPNRQETLDWQRSLASVGWGAPNWPKAFGGTGWSELEKLVFLEECSKACAPSPHVFNITMLGPVLIAFGSDEQRAYWLPKLLNADVVFCQGFSEPNAGSDLASLRTTARPDGEDYIVNGQKIWTTGAQYADWIFCLVRTGTTESKHKGISFLLVRLDTPGIVVRPIISIDGRHSLNEVFFEDVRVPKANLVGEENKGWEYARFLLANERTSIAGVARSLERLNYALELVTKTQRDPDSLIHSPHFRIRIAILRAEIKALNITQHRVLLDTAADPQFKSAAASALKIQGTDLFQQIMDLLLEVGGLATLRLNQPALGDTADDEDPQWFKPLAAAALYSRAASIYGGANEVQKNILSRFILGK